MKVKLYNTLTRKEEDFTPLVGNEVRIYSCGPTVYSYAHIGNFRSYVFMDNLRRVLRYNGYTLKHVMNITDVGHLESDADEGEDKMEKAARKENKNPYEIAEFYTKAFFKDMDKLNIDRPEIIAKATDHIPEMLEYVKEIIKNGYAYETSKGIYFDISKLDKYPVLSNRKLDEQIAGARVDVDEEKRNLAKQNNINYIEIDCSKSDINFIKNNIFHSKLYKLLNLDKININWDDCDAYGRKNLIFEVCSFFNANNSLTVDQLSEHFKLERSTITKYLHIGTNLSWCNYNSKEKLRIGQKKTVDILNQKRVEEHGFIYIYDNDKLICKACNGHEASRMCKEKGYDISPTLICAVLRTPNKNMSKGLFITYGK